MKRRLGIMLVIILFAVLGIAFLGYRYKVVTAAAQVPQGMVFFYGTECPHCREVETFLQRNKIGQRIKFTKKEVYHNQANLQQLVFLAKKCHANLKYLELPLLWTGKTCVVGQKRLLEFFANFAQQ